MKCLPASKLQQANGVALHDWHAEVLTIRAFNRFLLDECRRLAQDSTAQSDFLRRRTREELSSNNSTSWHAQPFDWNENLTLHMYCSEAPCGDASMELIITDDTTTTTAAANLNPHQPHLQRRHNPELLGRGYFSHSASDKLTLKQCTSLLSSLTSLFVAPERVYLTSVVLPESQYSEVGCRRCFSAGNHLPGSKRNEEQMMVAELDGRMAPVKEGCGGTGYAFRPFRVDTTKREFEFSRRGIQGGEGESDNVKVIASNLALAWTNDGEVEEGLIGGVMQGRKAFDVKGASLTSRRKMWAAAVEVAAALRNEEISKELANGFYDGVKEGILLEGRRSVKEEVRQGALKGWLRITGDGSFSL
ncbi:hypothetical protein N0V88_003740 [Collariella sp. IMI 366227]|nr:hypothetical protein N0V88_003740 [Collariella sp. IMI 366227]